MIYDSRLWLADLDTIVSGMTELRELAGKTVLITGACGLICSTIVDVFIRYNESKNSRPIQIKAAGRSEEKMYSRFRPYVDKDYFDFLKYDATSEKNDFPVYADYIIHGAGNAYPDKMIAEPVETMVGNFNGLLGLLRYAKESGSKRVLYISSSEVYGKKADGGPYREDEYGFVDLLNPRSCYPTGKRAAETLCAGFASEYGLDTAIVRPGHIYGPTASREDNRVSAVFSYAAARGEEIMMKSGGEQLRSYCYCLDCASAILKVLLFGKSNQAYNISNPNSVITIKKMAEILAEAGNVKLTMHEASESEKRSFNPMDHSSLDSAKLQGLGWSGYFTAEEGLSHTVRILREI